tara:strand:+ start:1214 stop:1981 length:768 start_codon:yes stop_codon:yes gene_type:complete
MLDILGELKSQFNVLGVKAEFEAEGTRDDDLFRLSDIVKKSGLDLVIKIGGCEAISDLNNCKRIGVERIVAPMIESNFAFQKYIDSINKVFDKEEISDISFFINLETISAMNIINELSQIAIQSKIIEGFVLGRVDFTGSMGLGREHINSEEVLNYAKNFCKIMNDHNLAAVVGGGISKDSHDFLKTLNDNFSLSSFETRKILFPGKVSNKNYKECIDLAVTFELYYLKNKLNYYSKISYEDKDRIQMLEKRVKL